jgi:hypothetical protein
MATAIGISTGPLTANRTFQNDAAAQEILLRFAASIDAQGTNAQKLMAVTDWCVGQIQKGAREYQFGLERDVLRATIEAENILT